MSTPEEDFLEWAERDRERSQHTMTKYRAVLDNLREYTDPTTATVADVEAWWKTRYDFSASTRATDLACLRTFYKFCTAFDHRTDDPTRRLFAPKIPKRMPRMVGQNDFDRLIGDLTSDAPDLRRAYALGAYAGLRVAEVAGLNWDDIDLDSRRMYVTGKGDKERPVPINVSLLNYLLPEGEGNVINQGGVAYSPGVLQKKINRHMARHGIKHTFHDMRKRGASILLSRGANPVAVRVMFGWSSMETVSKYAVVGDDELDQIAALLN